MQNTQTFLNKFFWWIIALLGVMLFLWWLLFSPIFQSANASTTNAETSSSSSSMSAMTSESSSSAMSSSSSSLSAVSSSSQSSSSSSSMISSSSSSSAANTSNLIPSSQNGKYAKTFANGNDGYAGVNFRKAPCGELAGEFKVWNLKGTINQAPVTDTNCKLGTYTWYLVEFEDNTKGWVVENNLAFSTTK